MITGTKQYHSHERGLDSVASALDLLLEEIERERDCANRAGSDALLNGDYSEAKVSMARSEILTDFYAKAAALHKEWRKLAKTAVLNGGGKSGSGRRNLGKLPKGLRIPESEYIEPILRVLVEMGGRGRAATIVERVGEVMQPVLRDVDRGALTGDGKPRWLKAANWARRRMVLDGLLKSDSPRGIWEISEAGRAPYWVLIPHS